MAGELFKSMADINAVHVPYKGSSGARTDIIGGQVDLMFDAVTTMTEQVRGGKVKALATQLTSGGHLRAGTAQPLGVVKTGVAVKTGRLARLSVRPMNSRQPCWRPPASTLQTRSSQRPAFTL